MAPRLLPWLPPAERLFEPFAGSAAFALAALANRTVQRVVLADSYPPLAALWQAVVDDPASLADGYEALWRGQQPDPVGFYLAVRARFAERPEPAALLYLLARCVKNAPRWNAAGQFNQTADHRRLGTRPERQRAQLLAAHALLRGRCEVRCGDAAQTTFDAGPADSVYLDPPWQGTSEGRDHRYHAGLARAQLVALLHSLQARRVGWLLSYDGALLDAEGNALRQYGTPLPAELGASHQYVVAGRSSQATLSGRAGWTAESLYRWPVASDEREPATLPVIAV